MRMPIMLTVMDTSPLRFASSGARRLLAAFASSALNSLSVFAALSNAVIYLGASCGVRRSVGTLPFAKLPPWT